MEDEQNKGGEEIAQDVETLESKERKRSVGGETTNDQTRDDTWMSAFFFKDTCYNTLSQAGACAQMSVRENTRVRMFCSQNMLFFRSS